MPSLADVAASGTANVSRGQRLKQQAMADMTAQEAAQQRAVEWLMSQPDALRRFLQSLEQRVRGASLAELAENPEYVAAAQAGRGQGPLLQNLAADVVGAAGELAPSRMDLATGMMAKVPALAAKMGMVAGPIVYHAGPRKFAPTPDNPLGEFDPKWIGSGSGDALYGAGVYTAGGRKTAKRYKNKGGYLYTADLPDEMADKMLDWDAPLSQQPEAVRKAVQSAPAINDVVAGQEVRQNLYGDKKWYVVDADGEWGSIAYDTKQQALNNLGATESRNLAPNSMTGQGVYEVLINKLGDQFKVSEYLSSLGIPGIKYFDQYDSPSKNYVVFPGSEKRVRILKREQ